MTTFHCLQEQEIYPLPMKDGFLVYAPLAELMIPLKTDEVIRLEKNWKPQQKMMKPKNFSLIFEAKGRNGEPFLRNISLVRYINSPFFPLTNAISNVAIVTHPKEGKTRH